MAEQSSGFTDEDRRRLTDTAVKVNTLHRIVTGESEPERGMVVRLDRLEQARKNATWIGRTAMGAAITAAVLALWSLVTGKHQ